METAAYLLNRSAIGFDLVGPVLVLLVVKRRGASWKRALKMCVLSATAGAFLVSGTLNTLHAVLTGMLFSDGPKSLAQMAPFPSGGAVGVLVAILGLTHTLPVVGLWSVIHRRSFGYVTNTSSATEVRT